MIRTTTAITAVGSRRRLRGAAALVVGASLLLGGALARTPLRAVAADGAGTITTVAGGGVGDGGPADRATVYPRALAVDSKGALYITDQYLARVRRVSGGVITTIAGTGDAGYSGDSGPATQARISANLGGIAVAPAGDVYFVDIGNRDVRRIDTHGTITTVVSAMENPTGGIAVDPGGNLYVVEGNWIFEYPPGGGTPTLVAGGCGCAQYNGDGIPAVAASISGPLGLAFDAAGDLYIADTGLNRVRRIDAGSKTISTVLPQTGTVPQLPAPASTPSPQYTAADTTVVNSPRAVAVGRNGVVYVADTLNDRVLQVSAASVSKEMSVPQPIGVAVAPSSSTLTVYASGYGLAAVYNQFGGVVAGSARISLGGPTPPATIDGWAIADDDGMPATNVDMAPSAVAVDPAGNLVIADVTRVRRVTPSGRIETIAGTGTDPRAVASLINGQSVSEELGVDISLRKNVEGVRARAVNLVPTAVAVAGNGDVYFGDGFMHQVLRVGSDGILHIVAGNDTDIGAPLVVVFDDRSGGPARGVALNWPSGLAVAADGAVLLSDAAGPSDTAVGLVRRVDKAGTITTIAGSLSGPTCSSSLSNLSLSIPDGDGGPATHACLLHPAGLALDHSGNLYIAERGGSRVRRVDTGGQISTVAGTGAPVSQVPGYALSSGDGQPATQATLDQPTGVAVDGAGDLFISDAAAREIREVDRSGTISTIAGSALATDQWYLGQDLTSMQSTSAAPARGDGGQAGSSYLVQPAGVVLDSAGDLYVADTLDNRVRRIQGAGAVQHARPSSALGDEVAACGASADEAVEDAFVLSPHAASHRPEHSSRRTLTCTAAPRR